MSSRSSWFIAFGLLVAGVAIVTPYRGRTAETLLKDAEHVQEALKRDPKALAGVLVLEHCLPHAAIGEDQQRARLAASNGLSLERGESQVVGHQGEIGFQIVDGSGVQSGCASGRCRTLHKPGLSGKEEAVNLTQRQGLAPDGERAQELYRVPSGLHKQDLLSTDGDQDHTWRPTRPRLAALLPRLAALRELHRIRQR